MPVNIKGKEYITVAERVVEAHKSESLVSITTELVSEKDVVLFKATVTLTDNRVFTGYSAANPAKAIEKQSPYEVAETSAVGRALGFAGFGSVESISSADEIVKSQVAPYTSSTMDEKEILNSMEQTHDDLTSICPVHNSVMGQAVSKKTGQPYFFHKDANGKFCFGKGFKE